jgi:hypothetical protein
MVDIAGIKRFHMLKHPFLSGVEDAPHGLGRHDLQMCPSLGTAGVFQPQADLLEDEDVVNAILIEVAFRVCDVDRLAEHVL